MEVTNRRLLLLALLLGIITTFLVYFYLTKVETVSQTVEPTEKVVVAKMSILPKTVITKEMVELRPFKTSALSESTFSDLKDVVGKTTKETIYHEEPVIHERLVDKDYEKNHLSFKVPKGFRAVTLKFDTVMGIGGYVQEGDFVDVIGTYGAQTMQGVPPGKDISKIFLQNIMVLAVGSQESVPGSDQTKIDTITLAVKPHDAEKLTFTEEHGRVRLMLRPINEKNQASTDGVTNQNIFTP